MRVICFHFNVISCIYLFINKKHIQRLRCLFRWQWWKCRFTGYCTFVRSSGLNTVIITNSFRALYISTLIYKLYFESYILYYLKQLADLQMLKKWKNNKINGKYWSSYVQWRRTDPLVQVRKLTKTLVKRLHNLLRY